MLTEITKRLFGTKNQNGTRSQLTKKLQPSRVRPLRMEPLESREMLSVSPLSPSDYGYLSPEPQPNIFGEYGEYGEYFGESVEYLAENGSVQNSTVAYAGDFSADTPAIGAPSITAQPVSATYVQNESTTALTVVATAPSITLTVMNAGENFITIKWPEMAGNGYHEAFVEFSGTYTPLYVSGDGAGGYMATARNLKAGTNYTFRVQKISINNASILYDGSITVRTTGTYNPSLDPLHLKLYANDKKPLTIVAGTGFQITTGRIYNESSTASGDYTIELYAITGSNIDTALSRGTAISLGITDMPSLARAGSAFATLQVSGGNSAKIPASTDTYRLVWRVLNNTGSYTTGFGETLTVLEPQADLKEYTPSGWDSAIIIATASGATKNTAIIYDDENVYVRFAYINDSNTAISQTFSNSLYLDSTSKSTSTKEGLTGGSYGYSNGFNLGKLAAGTYTIKVVLDSTNSANDSNRANNTFTKTFTIKAKINAATPQITTQPVSAIYTQNATAVALTVIATRSDTGTLSYAWYKNTTNSTTSGTAITGATSAIYTPITTATGTLYYYVVVTNTNNSVNGSKTAAETSITASITVNKAIESDVKLVYTNSTGTSLTWVDEWTSFYVEIWVTPNSANGVVQSVSDCIVNFDPKLFQFDKALAGNAFESVSASTIGIGSVSISGIGNSIGESLFARLLFRPASGTEKSAANPDGVGVAVGTGINYATSVDSGFYINTESTEITIDAVSGIVNSISVPKLDVYPVLYDLNDDGVVNARDFSMFIKNYGKSTENSAAFYLYDFNMIDAKINTKDFSQFIKAYGKSRAKSLNITSDTYVQYAMTVMSNRALLAAELVSADFAYSTAAAISSASAIATNRIAEIDTYYRKETVADAALIDLYSNELFDRFGNISGVSEW